VTQRVTRYARPEQAHIAAANHAWLADLSCTVIFPELVTVTPDSVVLAKLAGVTPSLADLPQLAEAIGIMHRATAPALAGARLDRPWQAGPIAIPDFTESRRKPLHHAVRHSGLGASRIDAILDRAAHRPPSIYKDSNLRNFLVTAEGIAVVDFDDLTLAPYGYDLAKLITSLAMTYGQVPARQIELAIAIYNDAVGANVCTAAEMAIWTELNWHLTADYLGQNHYLFPWPAVRPWADPLL
jgi:Ser/Thr protein kinase RdoA (MazF antagonist)